MGGCDGYGHDDTNRPRRSNDYLIGWRSDCPPAFSVLLAIGYFIAPFMVLLGGVVFALLGFPTHVTYFLFSTAVLALWLRLRYNRLVAQSRLRRFRAEVAALAVILAVCALIGAGIRHEACASWDPQHCANHKPPVLNLTWP